MQSVLVFRFGSKPAFEERVIEVTEEGVHPSCIQDTNDEYIDESFKNGITKNFALDIDRLCVGHSREREHV